MLTMQCRFLYDSKIEAIGHLTMTFVLEEKGIGHAKIRTIMLVAAKSIRQAQASLLCDIKLLKLH